MVETVSTHIDFSNEEIDFSIASHTAVVSDLHLCESEPLNHKHPLWKKFKSKDFFFDVEFFSFLKFIHGEAQGKTVELILNGDIFDFDSVTSFPQEPGYHVSWLETRRGLDSEKEKSIYKIEVILKDHPIWVEALTWFVSEGHRVVFVIGNHDVELNWLDVQKKILELLNLDKLVFPTKLSISNIKSTDSRISVKFSQNNFEFSGQILWAHSTYSALKIV
jgi:hypothetical protein